MRSKPLSLSRAAILTAAVLLARLPTASAGNVVVGDVTATLGPDFFFDTAAIGGGDSGATVFTRDITDFWTSGATVKLKGLGWASRGIIGGGADPTMNTTATSATATFIEPGDDGVFGTVDDIVLGTRTNPLIYNGSAGNEYTWKFDADFAFTATAKSLRIEIAGYNNSQPAYIYRKSTTGSLSDAVKLSLAGTAVGHPVATANASGNWETITWTTPTGTVTGGLAAENVATIGGERTLTYRGLPANQTVSGLSLGRASAGTGRGTLLVTQGNFRIAGDVITGLDNTANDGVLRIYGGSLVVDGDVNLGRSAGSGDGLMEIGGGTVNIGGSLNLGGYLAGGSTLRFLNPGSSPPVAVGGLLEIARSALNLTFDRNYVHTPGKVIPLLTYASRDGQFVNVRNGEEFNNGPNRFRIAYDAPSGGKLAITLTALRNYPASAGPNVVFILADDQGSADLRLYGDPKFPMPAVETLASAGARFTRAYTSGGVCAPTRCGLLTGIYQERFGSENNLGGPARISGCAPSQRTILQRMQAQGYRTYGIGKWHMGNTSEFNPNQRGFDRWYGINAGSRSYYTATGEDNLFQNDMELRPQDEGLYVADRIGNAAVAFIDEQMATNPAQPFYMYVSFTSVHSPVDIKSTDARFTRLNNEFGLTLANYTPTVVFPSSTAATVQANRYSLAAMTLALDENVAKIVNKLDAAGLTNNTIVVYLNDNGGAGWVPNFGGNYSYNTPLRGYKGGEMVEGSIRVPAVIKWPGVIPAAQVISTPVISLDFVATAVNAGGNAPAAVRNGLEGLDLMPLVRDGVPLPDNRAMFWRSSYITTDGSAARMGDWKILANNLNNDFKLYNLATDVGETTDVSAANPAIFNDLKTRFKAWNTGNIEPLFGTTYSDVSTDNGLEISAIRGGYRINARTTAPGNLTGILRHPVGPAADFTLGFFLRPAETAFDPAARLWFNLGDSATRANLIHAGIDYGAGVLRLEVGRTGGSATAPLPAPPTGFTESRLTYSQATHTLTFACAGASVSLPLGSGYDNLNTYGCGALAMEGEVTQPFQSDTARVIQIDNPRATAGRFDFTARNASDLPFDPKLERATDVAGPYTTAADAVIVALGGGLYQFSVPKQPAAPREFFRVTFGPP